MSPPAQMAPPTRSLRKCKRRCAPGSSAEKGTISATNRELGRDEQHPQEEVWSGPGGAEEAGGAGCQQRARGAGGKARNGEKRGGDGRRGTSRRGPAARGAATTRALSLVLVAACCARHGPSLVLPGVEAGLRPETDLTSNCFDFPKQNFDRDHCIRAVNGGNTPYLPLETGGDAIDFTLHSLGGDPWSLREALEESGLPVVMIFGMLTCPAFQGYGTTPPWDKCGYWDERELVEAYKGRATFVHIYGPEPHPTMPDTNFDKGITWQNFWSVIRQPMNYEARVAAAERIAGMVHPEQEILVDYLPGNPYSELIQPVWCSYSMGARPVTVITPDSKIFFQRGWFHAGHVAGAIEEYWCLQQQQRQEGQPEQQVQEPESGCSPSGGGDSDMGDGGSPPLAGVLSGGAASASLPPWLR